MFIKKREWEKIGKFFKIKENKKVLAERKLFENQSLKATVKSRG